MNIIAITILTFVGPFIISVPAPASNVRLPKCHNPSSCGIHIDCCPKDLCTRGVCVRSFDEPKHQKDITCNYDYQCVSGYSCVEKLIGCWNMGDEADAAHLTERDDGESAKCSSQDKSCPSGSYCWPDEKTCYKRPFPGSEEEDDVPHEAARAPQETTRAPNFATLESLSDNLNNGCYKIRDPLTVPSTMSLPWKLTKGHTVEIRGQVKDDANSIVIKLTTKGKLEDFLKIMLRFDHKTSYAHGHNAAGWGIANSRFQHEKSRSVDLDVSRSGNEAYQLAINGGKKVGFVLGNNRHMDTIPVPHTNPEDAYDAINFSTISDISIEKICYK